MSASAPRDAIGEPATVIARDSLRSGRSSTWLRATADIDMASERQARTELSALCDGGPPTVVLQFPNSAYVDVRGLAVLLHCARALRERSGALFVVNAPYPLRRMLQVLDIRSELVIARSRREAESWIRHAGLHSK